ncbi:MAG TPA: hypothetical protein VHM30_08435, partial [Gemmatimonadaceae bacterium]|nr:hypothetical protein [Gemmatimonadaceae bacterium]
MTYRRACLTVLFLFGAMMPGLATSQPPARDSLPLVPLRTPWPEITAIDVVSLGSGTHLQVTASGDGWVSLAPLYFGGPRYVKARLLVTAAEAAGWAARMRASLSRGLDVGAAGDSAVLSLPSLGWGPGRLHGTRWHPGGRQMQGNLRLSLCGPAHVGYDVGDAAWLRLAAVMDRAARVALAARRSAKLPTLERPYYLSEVSCGAVPLGDNDEPRYPEHAGKSRTAYEVGVQLVVDTAGRVEPGTIEVLPGTDTIFANAARTLVASWRFSRAWWSGWPVRQIAQFAIVFDPEARPDRVVMHRAFFGRYEPRLLFEPTDDGRVLVMHGSWTGTGDFTGRREWYEPDTMRAWLAQLEARVAQDRVSPKRRGQETGSQYIGLGTDWRHGPRLMAGYAPQLAFSDPSNHPDSIVPLRAQLDGCGTSYYWGERVDSAFLARVRRAVSAAHARRSAPAPVTDRVYTAAEVACRAAIAEITLGDARFPSARAEPLGPQSPALNEARAWAEVMTSFVVDTLGHVVPGTLSIMRGSDFRAAAALEQEIGRYAFSPAYRSGRRVRQRMIRTWLFLPTPICERQDAGIDCPRRYGPNEERKVVRIEETKPTPPRDITPPPKPAPGPTPYETVGRALRGCYLLTLFPGPNDVAAVDSTRRIAFEIDTLGLVRPKVLTVAPGVEIGGLARWVPGGRGHALTFWGRESGPRLLVLVDRDSATAYALLPRDSTPNRVDGRAKLKRIECGVPNVALLEVARVWGSTALETAAKRRGTGGLTVIVEDEHGGRLQRARVKFVPTPGQDARVCGRIQPVSFDEEHPATLTCLPVDTQVIQASAIGYRAKRWRVNIRAGYTDTTHVRLARETCDLACMQGAP